MRIKNWEKYQHYKDRNPPWIKLHYDIINSQDWIMLSDASRVLMIASMLLASRNNGDIPESHEYIKKACHLTKVDFNPLIKCGFIVNASKMLADDSTVLADASASVSVLDLKGSKELKKTYKDFVLLTDKDYQKLVDRFGANETEKRIERLNNYLGSTGKRYKSHYHTILNWAGKESTTPDPLVKKDKLCACGGKAAVTIDNEPKCRKCLEG